MPNLSIEQWGGAALIVVGLVWWLAPNLLKRLKTSLPEIDLPNLVGAEEDRLDRFGRLAALQDDLERRGCREQSEIAGTWYALLRGPETKEEEP